MSNPSSTEVGSSTPDASATPSNSKSSKVDSGLPEASIAPSTSRQQSTEVDSALPDASTAPSTSRQQSTEVDSGFPDASIAPSTSRQQSTEIDSPLPDASTAPSTSKQSIEVSSSPPEGSATSPSSGQPPVRPPLSSIEVDPNNPPPETPSPKNEPVVKKNAAANLTCKEKLNIQLPLWRKHLHHFRWPIVGASIIFVLATAFCISAQFTDHKEIYLGIGFGIYAVCFTFVWLCIPAGPPFQCDDEGKPQQPEYLKPAKVDDGSSPESFIYDYSGSP